jgi:hypothetical protein
MAIYDINGNEIVIVDNTLTQSGQAADAKKVGDELRDIQTQLGDGDERRY